MSILTTLPYANETIAGEYLLVSRGAVPDDWTNTQGGGTGSKRYYFLQAATLWLDQNLGHVLLGERFNDDPSVQPNLWPRKRMVDADGTCFPDGVTPDRVRWASVEVALLFVRGQLPQEGALDAAQRLRRKTLKSGSDEKTLEWQDGQAVSPADRTYPRVIDLMRPFLSSIPSAIGGSGGMSIQDAVL